MLVGSLDRKLPSNEESREQLESYNILETKVYGTTLISLGDDGILEWPSGGYEACKSL